MRGRQMRDRIGEELHAEQLSCRWEDNVLDLVA